MKAVVLTGVWLLSACAAPVPIAELERQAMLTGDWSEVERREQIIARRAARTGPICDTGLVSYCINSGGDERCTCVSSQSLRDMVSNHW